MRVLYEEHWGIKAMSPKKFQMAGKMVLMPLLGLLAFLLYMYVFHVDILQIIATAQRINLYLYLMATVAVILDTLFFAIAWYFLLRFLSVKLSIIKAFLFVWFGVFIDTLIPAESISGEISKVYLVTREQNGVGGKVVASLVTQRLIGMIITVVSLSIGAILLLLEKHLSGTILNLTLFIITATFLFLVLLLFLCIKEKWTLKIVDALIWFAKCISRGRWKLVKIREKVVEGAKAFLGAMREFRDAPETLFIASSFSVISWILTLTVFYLVFLSIGYASVSWSAILLICSIFMAVKSIPIGIPFEVGLPEITLTTLFILVGVPPETSATATILTRILTLWFRFFIGFAVQQLIGTKAVMVEIRKRSRTSNHG